MAHEVIWTQEVYDEFIKKANLNPTERKIFDSRVLKEYTIQMQSSEFGICVSRINEIIYEIKKKYDDVQKTSDILKPRENKSKRKKREKEERNRINTD